MKSTDRKKQLGEVFTPPQLVNEMLDQLPSDQFTTPTKLFLDPTCGNGNFLVEVLKRKLPHTTRKQALLTTFGADLMFDNCVETILRLYYDFPFYNTNNTINDAARQALDEESCKVKNNTSDYVEILDLTTIVETHFQYYNSPQITNSLFAPKAVSPDTARLAKHTANLTSMQYATPRTQDGKSHTLLEFLRPGLLALFICKKTVNGVN
ncbi:MAG: SAM-dependent DNA methyltransferase [Richelia sp. RM2_1_2]|nr:SAM-dependent DNA methyltransferase [Richelia sp. RM2_1_2]